MLKTTPTSLINGSTTLGFESYKIWSMYSFEVDISRVNKEHNLYRDRGMLVELSMRKYARCRVTFCGTISPIYFAYFLQSGYLQRVEENNDISRFIPFFPGVLFGYRLNMYQLIVIDAFVGFGSRVTIDETSYLKRDPSKLNFRYNGVMPRVGVKVGIGLNRQSL